MTKTFCAAEPIMNGSGSQSGHRLVDRAPTSTGLHGRDGRFAFNGREAGIVPLIYAIFTSKNSVIWHFTRPKVSAGGGVSLAAIASGGAPLCHMRAVGAWGPVDRAVWSVINDYLRQKSLRFGRKLTCGTRLAPSQQALGPVPRSHDCIGDLMRPRSHDQTKFGGCCPW